MRSNANSPRSKANPPIRSTIASSSCPAALHLVLAVPVRAVPVRVVPVRAVRAIPAWAISIRAVLTVWAVWALRAVLGLMERLEACR